MGPPLFLKSFGKKFQLNCIDERKYRVKHAAKTNTLLVKLSIPLLIPLHFTLFSFLYFVFAAFAFFFQEHSLPSINCTDIMLFLHSSEASYLNELIILHTLPY